MASNSSVHQLLVVTRPACNSLSACSSLPALYCSCGAAVLPLTCYTQETLCTTRIQATSLCGLPLVPCRDVPISQRALVQKIAVVYWVGHYAKRIAETFLVHT